jgi:hypothetical protein
LEDEEKILSKILKGLVQAHIFPNKPSALRAIAVAFIRKHKEEMLKDLPLFDDFDRNRDRLQKGYLSKYGVNVWGKRKVNAWKDRR